MNNVPNLEVSATTGDATIAKAGTQIKHAIIPQYENI